YRMRKQTNIQLEIKQEEINAQNVVLKKLLEDKEWLLKEIHHRVKNNLQVIISLLNTQSRYLDNKDALAAIRNSQHRMYAMSLIHQRLYQTDNLGKINMSWYIRELTGYMQDSFETGRRITFELDIDAVEVDVVQAAPLGLILNEAVSNAIKYAFPDNRKGIIRVSLKHKPDGDSLLSISDNGVGFDEETDITERDSLGMSLMQGLSLQLDGTFSIRNNHPGVIITVRFLCRDFTFKTAFTTADA
ncbi:MAG TPA: sensor histidine kinase, partial [Chitinophaga sp.]|nr:sensor histidine kinase [Chitinophaga sp.]